MLLELGKFASLLLGILSLCAVFHAAFFVPDSTLPNRLLDALKFLALASGICWGSGWIFRCWERKAGFHPPAIIATLPVKMFLWAAAGIVLLFLVSWYIESCYLPLRTALSR